MTTETDAQHVRRRDNERLALRLRSKLCDECYLDVKLLGRRVISRCPHCARKAKR